MERKRSVRNLAALLAVSAIAAAGCGGEGGQDAVFLYMINGAPSVAAMDVIGPTGVLTSGAAFGDRMARDGVCTPEDSRGENGEAGQRRCIPIRVDRQLGTDFDLIMENTPTVVEAGKDLYSMYPHETGTMVFTRKSGEAQVDATLFRHVQTISSDCSIYMVNGLALDNQYTADLNNYTIAPEFRLDPAQARFGDEANTPFLTECGPLPTDQPEHMSLARTGLLDQIAANPWFFPVDCADAKLQNVFCWAWGIPDPTDGRARLYTGAQVVTVLNSQDYFECIEGALTIKQPEDPDNPLPFPDADAQVQCPDEPITWADVQVNAQAVADCLEPVVRNTNSIDPGMEDGGLILQGPQMCSTEFRVRNVGQDIVFGPQDGDELGRHQNGALVGGTVEVPTGSQHFWVMLGRPVNPIIWQWDSGDTFVDLSSFPYFNGKNEEIDNYDSP